MPLFVVVATIGGTNPARSRSASLDEALHSNQRNEPRRPRDTNELILLTESLESEVGFFAVEGVGMCGGHESPHLPQLGGRDRHRLALGRRTSRRRNAIEAKPARRP